MMCSRSDRKTDRVHTHKQTHGSKTPKHSRNDTICVLLCLWRYGWRIHSAAFGLMIGLIWFGLYIFFIYSIQPQQLDMYKRIIKKKVGRERFPLYEIYEVFAVRHGNFYDVRVKCQICSSRQSKSLHNLSCE